MCLFRTNDNYMFLVQEERLEREQRLGPGGLDPVEVFESLPEVSKSHLQLTHMQETNK